MLERAQIEKNETNSTAPGRVGVNSNNSSAAPGIAASALRLDFSGLVGIGLLAPLLLIGAATYIFRRMKAVREQKEA